MTGDNAGVVLIFGDPLKASDIVREFDYTIETLDGVVHGCGIV